MVLWRMGVIHQGGKGSEGWAGRDESRPYGIGDVEFIRAERGSEGRAGRDGSRPYGVGEVEFIRAERGARGG